MALEPSTDRSVAGAIADALLGPHGGGKVTRCGGIATRFNSTLERRLLTLCGRLARPQGVTDGATQQRSCVRRQDARTDTWLMREMAVED